MTESSTTVPSGIRYWCETCRDWYPAGHAPTHYPFPDLPDPLPQPFQIGGLGWECPRCRAIHAPWILGCGCPVPTITTTGRNAGEIAG